MRILDIVATALSRRAIYAFLETPRQSEATTTQTFLDLV